jgi:hypothetical protein
MIWLLKVGLFLDYKIAYSNDSESTKVTKLLECFSPADAVHTKYPLQPININATKQQIDGLGYCYRVSLTTKIGQSQVIMEMVKNSYITIFHDISMNTLKICIWIRRFGTSNTHSTAMLIHP